ncbi:MAG: PEP-CTERM sorting domain-containing protein [Okeania sp. SIO2F4]|uniref:PEP-CTERM sorting domain-containing protein n=1 Tax=Okeania sp. SIO2F4 TaxID=2607790 RepID=UPI0014291188|nr:PEP-CTERM sorting domain-containing protein [Okeania sp. SIO2F4]NES03386.1 PEP-CTERM sorting domain-containing protein [Okeania sp. SIO2F4]
MISLLKKFSALAICTTAISLVGIKANVAQALTFELDIEVGNNSFSGFLDVVNNAFDDNMLDEQELEQLVINNFALGDPSVTLPATLIFNDFTDSNFNVSVIDLFSDTLNNINGKLVGQTDDGSSSFSLLVGNNTINSSNELEFVFTSTNPIFAFVGDGLSFNFTETEAQQTDVLSIALAPVSTSVPEPASTPEPASILGLLAVGAAGAVSTLKRKQK